jgi:glycosyltransferase involved in cell wall biosynthesis
VDSIPKRLSIIVPTYNRDLRLLQTLESVANTIEPGASVEIIVVDNGSTDRTVDACREIIARFPQHGWRYFYDDVPGLLTGRHRGAGEAAGEVLAYLDDDVLLAPSWWDALQDAFSDPDVMLVGGPSFPHYEVEPPSWLAGQWIESEGNRRCGALSSIDCGPGKKEVDPLYVWGLNFSIRKTAFEACGGFHPDCVPKALQRYQGDGETGLAHKLKVLGLKALYHPGVALKHVIPASRLTPESFEQWAFYQGVCDSYTDIRCNGSLPAMRTKSWKDLLRPIRRKVQRERILRNPTIEGVRNLVIHAHSAGVQFHQDEVHKDPKLFEWILKPDYFDYRLPDGWENYVGQSAGMDRRR